jgi:spermidine/putrescine transport system substrate-binding protein
MPTAKRGSTMNDHPHRSPSLAHTLRRRELLARAAQMGIALPTLGALASACGGSSSSSSGGGSSASAPPTGTAVVLNYDGWMGKHTVADFKTKYPGANLKQASESSISTGAVVPALKANLSTYDGALGDQAVVGQAIAADVLQPLDWSKIPNIKNVDEKFRQAYSHGVPSDYGKTGIGYRTDLVSEDITSWADVWNLAEKYSNKIVFIDLDRDCIGSALKYKGHSVNSTDEGELNDALQALLQIKPHLQALKSYNIGAGLAKGSYAIAMDWDYDVALSQADNSNIKWVLPSEGASAYLEGFFAVKDTPDLGVFEEFFNFFLEPQQYADFVNTTGTAYVSDAATPYIKKAISSNPALIVDPATLANVEFENYLGEATATYNKIWDEFKSA